MANNNVLRPCIFIDEANGIDETRQYLQVRSVWIILGAANANPLTLR